MSTLLEQINNLPLLIGGRLVAAAEPIQVVNPSTAGHLAVAMVGDEDLLQQAVGAAREARATWASDEARRRQVLQKMADTVVEHADTLTRVLCLEIGIPLKAAQTEVAASAAFMRHRANTPLKVDVLYDDPKQSVQVVRTPIGVVGAILPWNAPLLIASEKISTAFSVGNTVVLKPSSFAPLAILLLGKLLLEVVPPGVLNIVTGPDKLGAALVSDPDVGMISFTGSIEAGRAIMANAAPGLKRLSLELGGNDPAIVLPDVDVDRVVNKLFWGAFYRSGQICAAIKRLYVHEDVYDRLVGAMAKVAQAAVVGDPFDPKVTMGPLSNRPQYERVRALVDSAVAAGGKVVGGQAIPGPGYFYSPTLVTDVGPDVALVAQEQFGPVLPVMRFKEVADAVRAANATPFGLGGSVWSSNLQAATEVARELDSGSVWVNRHGLVMPDIPFGGTKQSGVGRANGATGVDQYSELKTVSISLS